MRGQDVQDRTVEAGRTAFRVCEHGGGTGRPVLLLHGVPQTSACWREVAPALARGRRVLAVDLPGLGGSRYDGPYDLPSVAAELAALVDAEVGGPVDLAGHDWGGMTALALAGLRPDLVARLVVLDAPYKQAADLLHSWYVGVLALPLLADAAFRLAGPRLVRAMLRGGWGEGPPLDDERLLEYSCAYAAPAQVRAMLGYYRAVARPRRGALRPGSALAQVVPDVHVPGTVVVWGAQDPALPVSVGEAAVRALGPDTRMVTVPRVGHFVVEEAPGVVLDVLSEAFALGG